MDIENYIHILENPQHIEEKHTSQLKEVIEAYPFFQSAHSLYLKCLKNEESSAYNDALKKTAAHTTNRAVLFDFITSDAFLQNDISASIKAQEKRLREISITDEEDLSIELEEKEQQKATKILDPNLFVEKENSSMTRAVETLKVGAPLPFTTSESHSFSEWLKIASFKPIDRSSEATTDTNAKPQQKSEEDGNFKLESDVTQIETENDTTTEHENESLLIKKRKQEIIDSFIQNNPKISRTAVIKSKNTSLSEDQHFSPDALMTETLARVYVEQKNYKKAKQAFRILSLKYPEKSGFFADQIRAVEELEEQ